MISEVITACGDDPVPTVCLPTRSVLRNGDTPSSSETRIANPPSTSSSTGASFFIWSFAFIPSFAVAPPATTTTFLYTPAFTSDAADITECAGAAQNPLMSDPVAFTNPQLSAMALAKFPPPLWFMSPHASSEHSITYSTSAGEIPAFFIRCLAASTPDALTTRFSNITCDVRLRSTSCALFTHPTSFPSYSIGSECSLLTSSSITSNSSPDLKHARSCSVNIGSAFIFSTTISVNSFVSFTRSKASEIFIIAMNSACGCISPYFPYRDAFSILCLNHGCE